MNDSKLLCRDVWKLFGKGADRFLTKNAGAKTEPPSLEQLLEAGLIPAVRAANLDIRNGESFVIMGLSGSGKSTLLRCMSRLIEPSLGQLVFEGQDLRTVSSREMINIRRHKMGMVFQHFALLPHLTVLQNVAFPLSIQGLKRDQQNRRAMEVIELVGLAGRENYLPRQLSGGQQQRVGIARSLAVEPEIWFLDEPFSALDPLIRREMQDEFMRLQAKLKKTIVFITHDFDEAIRLADRIAIMKDGEIIQVATPEDLVINPADDYVREFTRYVPRDKVISVGAIMSALHPNETQRISEGSYSVKVTAKVADVTWQVCESNGPVDVLDADGFVVGTIRRDDVVDFLVAETKR